MKAVVIRSPGRGVDAWALVDRPEPVAGPGELLVRVRAASLNYRDLAIARGVFGGPVARDLVAVADGAGEVVAVGAGVTTFRAGDRVAAAYFPTWRAGAMRPEDVASRRGAYGNPGVLSELAVWPATGVVRVPAHLSFEEAATLPCAAVTAWRALVDTPLRAAPGATVLVQGTGGVSLFAVQLARASGLRVIATTSRAAKAPALRRLGAEAVIDTGATPEWQDEVVKLTDGAGVDQLIEVGGPGTLARSLQALKPGGTLSLVGVLTGFAGQIDPMSMLYKTLRVEGVLVGSVESFENMNRAIAAHGLRPVIDEVFPIDRAPAALAKLESQAHVGKIVISV
jgi:NADPH:quinone reductase-like Zn-dependent oxidoreductase